MIFLNQVEFVKIDLFDIQMNEFAYILSFESQDKRLQKSEAEISAALQKRAIVFKEGTGRGRRGTQIYYHWK